ncbi:hypothetical protein [Rhizobacter sp. Root1221]|uniref:hypothetical protein n=1 Tax=Rhizobacter sp. Root1221 TaxID=1736433 RepID=UPI001910C4F1|nr:hypothetical protein [Rhizobacter sp. Root1221]
MLRRGCAGWHSRDNALAGGFSDFLVRHLRRLGDDIVMGIKGRHIDFEVVLVGEDGQARPGVSAAIRAESPANASLGTPP